MKHRSVDLNSISRILVALVIGAVFIYLMYGMSSFGESNVAGEAKSVEKIINRSLMQYYALEGRYPQGSYYGENNGSKEFMEKLGKYGVIFNEDKYLYIYEPSDISNIKPNIRVVEKQHIGKGGMN